ncbi:MAG: helicase [Proteobacteria bacterium]|nr:helicase [Pseudomonadota bacterium]MCP4918791.1 helicase [Pseudomonadota bacterium]
MPALRFTRSAAAKLAGAIAEARGVEVFAIGDVDPLGRVSRLEIHCRGTEGAVPALMTRPRAGQVVIHNHPSGVLRPSDADFQLANRYGDEGIGVIIVDNKVENDNWVVEPARKSPRRLDRGRLVHFFEQDLPRVVPDAEDRPQQLEMAHRVADLLDSGGALVIEAGTGTGKSLAYLVPAVLWALANDSKVAVSTYTRSLQAQLMGDDLPILRAAGIDFEAALVKGRGNYLCRRKLKTMHADAGPDQAVLDRIVAWSETAAGGSLQELGEEVDSELWESIGSHGDSTLRARCPHYNQCFYYQARRRAAASHLLVLNHALLLADLSIKAQTDGDGVLPRFARVLVDEAHHLEDAATSVLGDTLTVRALSRAITPLLDRRKRKGALTRISERWSNKENRLFEICGLAKDDLSVLKAELEPRFDLLGGTLLGPDPQRRITDEVEAGTVWRERAAPALDELETQLSRAGDRLSIIAARLDEVEIPVDQAQPVLDLARGIRRLKEKVSSTRSFRDGHGDRVRWIEQAPRRGAVKLAQAPIHIAPVLQDLVWDRLEAVGATSATLAVGGRFDHWMERHGGPEETVRSVLPSPFDYREQALLLLPRDLPRPDERGWLDAVGAAAIRLIETTGGGAFVLCTSHAQVRTLGRAIDQALGARHPVLMQGRASRELLLRRFRESDGSILVGTDSFWEGVSVKGRALRLVIIPRLPFRVPTEPVAQARYERLVASGRDPFRAWSLPEAVIKLRQGFGRLVRSRADRGAVALLDRRIHDRWYGRVFLNALPPARRITGPMQRIVQELAGFDAIVDA